jgi:hypothetical protein
MLEEVDGVAAWQEDLGYLLLPGNPLHVAFLFRGDGRNGKGVLMDVMRALVGPGAVSSLSLEDMVSDRARFRLVGLVGSALNLCGELDPKFLASTAAFKGLTGGDVVQVERKNRTPSTTAPEPHQFSPPTTTSPRSTAQPRTSSAGRSGRSPRSSQRRGVTLSSPGGSRRPSCPASPPPRSPDSGR